MEFSFEDFSMMARGSTARSIGVMTLGNLLLCGLVLVFVSFNMKESYDSCQSSPLAGGLSSRVVPPHMVEKKQKNG